MNYQLYYVSYISRMHRHINPFSLQYQIHIVYFHLDRDLCKLNTNYYLEVNYLPCNYNYTYLTEH